VNPSSRPSARVIAALALFVAAAAVAPDRAVAAGRFKVGDRVEVDDLGNGKWCAGVVTAENDFAYTVRTDPKCFGDLSVNFTVPKKGVYESRIRPSSAGLPEAQKPNTSQPTGILDCPITEGIERRRLDEAVLAKLIRCMNEYKNGAGPSLIGSDSRFDITAMKVGSPRVWNVLNDIGPGTASTQVYPVQVSYTQTWWSRESVRTQKGISIYGCYYSTLSQWTCAVNGRIKQDPPLVQPRG
jgi:hypothetical protein